MKLRLALALAALAVPVTVATPLPAAAQDGPEVLNNANPEAFQVMGLRAKPKAHKDDAVQFGKAMRIPVAGGGGNPWDVAISVPIQEDVKAGDKLVLAYYARAEKLEEGKETARINAAQLQLSAAPYTSFMGKPAEVGTEWDFIQVPGTADKDYPKGTLVATLHLNTGGKHVIDIGPVAVLRLKQ